MEKLRLQQTLTRKLTPQQLQVLHLLQMPIAKLRQEVDGALAENPFLQEEESTTEDELPISTDVVPVYRGTRHRHRSDFEVEDFMDNQTDKSVSLQEDLLKQMAFLPLSPDEHLVATHLVESLTPEGYLHRSLAVVVGEIEVMYDKVVTEEIAMRMLLEIQRLGPPGVGARDLRECLLLQLSRKKRTDSMDKAIVMVRDHFTAFKKKHYAKLAKALELSSSALQACLDEIAQLRPYPVVPPKEDQGVVEPDFVVMVRQGRLEVLLLKERLPKLRIRRGDTLFQEEALGSSEAKKQAKKFIREGIQRAKWFIQSLEQRQRTLLLIMKSIVKLQRAFFETGDEELLQPIFLRNVADDIGMDISTVSRAIAHKAVQLHGAVYSLKYFFSEPIHTKEGADVSSRVVKHAMAKLIATEDKHAPYTDEQLTALLQKHGYLLARRTVAKYREQLSIPVARLRVAL